MILSRGGFLVTNKYIYVALLCWSAMFICSCSSSDVESDVVVDDKSKIPSIKSNNLTIRTYTKGKLAYEFDTELLEKYDFVEDPYMEFNKGVHIVTFNDSTFEQESELTADYAKYIEKRKLWEAKGNVVAKTQDGKTVLTEQVFWDEIADSIYSNVDTKVVDGEEVSVGTGFSSDGKFKEILIKNTRGRMLVDTTKKTVDTTLVVADSLPQGQ